MSASLWVGGDVWEGGEAPGGAGRREQGVEMGGQGAGEIAGWGEAQGRASVGQVPLQLVALSSPHEAAS